jgi:predicted dehydrogenase
MNVVGERGLIELDMFGQEVDWYSKQTPNHQVSGFGSNIDAGLIDSFVGSVRENLPSPITVHDGLAAVRIALAGYESARTGQPVPVN